MQSLTSIRRVQVVTPALLALSLLFVACSSAEPSDTTGEDTGPSDTQAGADCGAIAIYAPLVTVVNAVDGSSICDPTFHVASWPAGVSPGADDGGPVACHGSVSYAGCPANPADGAPSPCEYLLLGLGSRNATAKYTIEVSKAGFATATVTDVHGGVGGCVTPVEPSQLTVRLTPTKGDAGSD